MTGLPQCYSNNKLSGILLWAKT